MNEFYYFNKQNTSFAERVESISYQIRFFPKIGQKLNLGIPFIGPILSLEYKIQTIFGLQKESKFWKPIR